MSLERPHSSGRLSRRDFLRAVAAGAAAALVPGCAASEPAPAPEPGPEAQQSRSELITRAYELYAVLGERVDTMLETVFVDAPGWQEEYIVGRRTAPQGIIMPRTVQSEGKAPLHGQLAVQYDQVVPQDDEPDVLIVQALFSTDMADNQPRLAAMWYIRDPRQVDRVSTNEAKVHDVVHWLRGQQPAQIAAYTPAGKAVVMMRQGEEPALFVAEASTLYAAPQQRYDVNEGLLDDGEVIARQVLDGLKDATGIG